MAGVDFDIYLTIESKEIMYISEPLQRRILKLLYTRPANMAQMIAELDVPQSSMSVTMNKLMEATLVECVPDPDDNRKKIFKLNSLYFATSMPMDLNDALHLPIAFQELADSKGDFKSPMLAAIMIGVQTAGFDIRPWLRWIGYNVGLRMHEDMNAETVEMMLRELTMYFEENGLGVFNVVTHLPLTIHVDSPQTMPGFIKETKCAFIVGMLSSLLEKIVGSKFDVKPVEIEEVDEHDIYTFVIDAGLGLPDCMDIELYWQ